MQNACFNMLKLIANSIKCKVYKDKSFIEVTIKEEL